MHINICLYTNNVGLILAPSKMVMGLEISLDKLVMRNVSGNLGLVGDFGCELWLWWIIRRER